MKLLTWNVNGIRAIKKKGFEEIISILDPDFVCLQETKAQPEQIDLDDLYPYEYIHSAKKKGYSGTMIMTYEKPVSVHYGINQEEHDQEGRVITLEYNDFYLIDVYVPNAGENLRRLEYRQEWDKAFGNYISSLDKPVLVCGDFNVANQEMDVYNEKLEKDKGGMTKEERFGFNTYLLNQLVDVYRLKNPEERKYTWWSYYERGREKGEGWRIDYWLISPSLVDKVNSIEILDDIYGSDHCPVLLDIDL